MAIDTDAPFSFLPLGAIIQAFHVQGINIVQGFPIQDLYQEHNSPYFGETIGRVANRLDGAKLDSVNGRTYPLAVNDAGRNTLHGGVVGWGKRIWHGPVPVGVRPIPGLDGCSGESVQFTLVSDDGDEGFPGALDVKVIYTAATQQHQQQTEAGGRHDATVLAIEYEARLLDGHGVDETVINMTNHSYFNLGGAGHAATIDGTQVSLGASHHLPIDNTGIPTGSPPTVYPGVEVGKSIRLGATAPAFDHCFVTTADPASVPVDTRILPLQLHLAASHPDTGIHLQVLSTEPSFQFYTGDFTRVSAVEGVEARGARSAFCCEPGRWTNAANVPEWKGMTLLKKGETYGARIVYKAWKE